ncbi:hypothetical protein BDR26DRAFT_935506 [Obelidium mucronatum]|nr:hypothetical protein BDR26DRAFT_935506 [Obelidium mucronatum]
MPQTNETPYNGSPGASAAAVHGGWDDAKLWIWIWTIDDHQGKAAKNARSMNAKMDLDLERSLDYGFSKKGRRGAAEMGPLAIRVAYAPSTSAPRIDRWRAVVGCDGQLSNTKRRGGKGAAETGPLAMQEAFAPSTPDLPNGGWWLCDKLHATHKHH